MKTGALQHPQAIVFDLDGTLVDSAADIAAALNGAMAPLGVKPFSDQDVMAMIGGGSLVLIDKAALQAGIVLDPARKADIVERFMGVYRMVSAAGRGIYPGAVDLLMDLRKAGIKTAICTNKPAPVTDIAVKALGLDRLVDFVIGAREDFPKKPRADMLWACCTALGSEPGRTVMVGDSAADRGAASAAGCACILVDFGYSKVPVADLEPDAIVSRLADIRSAVGLTT